MLGIKPITLSTDLKGMTQNNQNMRFDPQLRARAPELKHAIKTFTRHLTQQEANLGLRSRTRKDEDRRKLALSVEALACNLLLLGFIDSGPALAAPLDNNMMWGRTRYKNPVYGQHFVAVLGLLEHLRLIKRTKTGYRISRTIKSSSLFAVSPSFGKHFPKVTTASFYREQEPEVLILKKGKGEDDKAALVNYRDDRKTRQLRNQVKQLNGHLLDANIQIANADASVRLDGDGEVIAIYRRTLRRTFNNQSWRQGGRLSGGFWMTMPRKDRFQRIRINGRPIIDVDYQQLFPRLAYVRARAPQPKGDLYDVMGDGTGRDGWKLLLNALLFTRGTLNRWPWGCSQHFPGMKLKQAIAYLKEKHEPISRLFGTGLGFELMFIESEMLIATVLHLFESGIPALPLHDAVLVAKPHAKAAKAAMESAFRTYTGESRAFVKVDFGP